MGRLTRTVIDFAASIAFVRKAAAVAPDVLFVPKAENLHHRAMRAAKDKCGAKLVVWYPDNPFRAENTSMNILRGLELVDIFYIWGKFLLDPLRSAGCARVEYLPFGFDSELHDLSERSLRPDIACQHVGSYSTEKRDALLPLAECGLMIWGPGWEMEMRRHGPLAKCVKGLGLYGHEMVDAYRQAIVIANPIRRQNMPAHNLRTIEAAGIGGGVVLTQRTKEQAEELFTEDKHLLCYDCAEEMAEKARWALEHPHLAAAMAARARERVFEQHLLEHRIENILADVREILDPKRVSL